MLKISRVQIALIAAASSVLTSMIHGGIQGIFAYNADSFINLVAYVIGRVIGDIPIALVCFGLSFVVSLKLKGPTDTSNA